MKKIALVILTAALLGTVACQKEFGSAGGDQPGEGSLPADFNWKMTKDVSVSVGAPVVDGKMPDYAVVRVYTSSILDDANMVAWGVAKGAPFNAAVTIPAGVQELYIRTILPDGTTNVRAIAVSGRQLSLSGAVMQASSGGLVAAKNAAARKASSMPEFPTMQPKNASDFAEGAIIRATPSSEFQLGASWSVYPAGAYYIPSDATITGNIDLNGYSGNYSAPVLYVAGKLTVSSLSIGTAVLAVLPGGEVTISGGLQAQDRGSKQIPAVYVFEGGKLSARTANLGSKSIVNLGTFSVSGLLDMNQSITFYNAAGATLNVGEVKQSNSGEFYNDGTITSEDLALTSSVKFENCENGVMTIGDFTFEAGNRVYQRGKATIDNLEIRGKLYVNCYTYAERIEAEGAEFFIASDACLESSDAEFNNTHANLAASSIFLTQNYNAAGEGQGNKFIGEANNDQLSALIRIEQKAVVDKKAKTDFTGRMELVYDASGLDDKYQLNDDKYLDKGAYLVAKQVINIPATDCNGGKGAIKPTPEPEPEFVETKGAEYSYCFEDNWPFLGDYDMNDLVVLTSIDRRASKDGSKVEFIRINWEPLAAGAKSSLAFAVQLDKVAATQIATVESTNKLFSKGVFAVANQPEAGNDLAVIPLFNSVNDVLAGANTWKGIPKVSTTKYTTTITFKQPVDADAVIESAMNFFIVVNRTAETASRELEVHQPMYQPTVFAKVTGWNTVTSANPYKFFVTSGNDMAYNGMMWALMIPGKFRYPAESNDIRTTYKNFTAWATSGGQEHVAWYLEESDAAKVY